jgi:hypothetical protein
MRVSILEGVYGDDAGNFLTTYPVNLQPVLGENGLADGFLRTEPGLTYLCDLPGGDRGAINWNGVCYRVAGTKLVKIVDAVVTVLGDVGGAFDAPMDYGFDRLGVISNNNLFYYDGTSVTQVTDPDLGSVIDVVWIDGYYLLTDGTSLIVTDLNDPYSINPLKYGSSEADPDPIVAVKKVRDELYAINRYTIENFQNIGGDGFPFQRNVSGLIPKGACGTKAVDYFLQSFAFVGSGRGATGPEATSVYIAGQGEAICISTREIDGILASYTVAEQSGMVCESRVDRGEQRFLIHLPHQTLVYNHQASLKNGSPVWNILASGVNADQPYAARHFCNAGGQWIAGSGSTAVIVDQTVETHSGQPVGWRFDTKFLYNETRGGIIKAVELVGLAGRGPDGLTNPQMFLSWTVNGATWSQERAISMGSTGQREQRMQWRPKTKFSNYMGLRFRGASAAIASFARLEVDIEPLNA